MGADPGGQLAFTACVISAGVVWGIGASASTKTRAPAATRYAVDRESAAP
jgi:hypothetical protein